MPNLRGAAWHGDCAQVRLFLDAEYTNCWTARLRCTRGNNLGGVAAGDPR
jgi:hypothetical protein